MTLPSPLHAAAPRRLPLAGLRALALLAALALSGLAAACDNEPASVTLAGRGITMRVADLQPVDGLVYQDTSGRYFNIGPPQDGHQLIVARVTIWNTRSGRLSLFVGSDAAQLQDADGQRFAPIDPYTRRVPLDAPAAVSEHLPLLWGPSDLPEDFSITGWMVFEAPVESEIVQFRWEQVDSLRFPIGLP